MLWGDNTSSSPWKRYLEQRRRTGEIVGGYAGGKRGAGGKNKDTVCYYYGAADTVYERLGHAEVVQIAIKTKTSLRSFARYILRTLTRRRLGCKEWTRKIAGRDKKRGRYPGGIENEINETDGIANADRMKLVRGEGTISTIEANRPKTIRLISSGS